MFSVEYNSKRRCYHIEFDIYDTELINVKTVPTFEGTILAIQKLLITRLAEVHNIPLLDPPKSDEKLKDRKILL